MSGDRSVCIESNVATVQLPGIPTITVRRVYRADGWAVRFDVEDQRGISGVGMRHYLWKQSYGEDHANQVVHGMVKLVFGPDQAQ